MKQLFMKRLITAIALAAVGTMGFVIGKSESSETAETVSKTATGISDDGIWLVDVAQYPGIAELDTDGNWSGVGIDMIMAAANGLMVDGKPVEVQFTNVTVSEGLSRTAAGTSEILVGFLDKTSSRLEMGLLPVTLTEGSKSLARLAGSGALPSAAGIPGDDYASQILTGSSIAAIAGTANRNVAVTYAGPSGSVMDTSDSAASIEAVLNGQATFVLDDSPRLWKAAQGQYAGQIEIVGYPFGYVPAGFYVAPGHHELHDKLDLQITRLRESGQFDESWYASFGNLGG